MKAWYEPPTKIEYSKEDNTTRHLLSKFLIENNIEFIPTGNNYQEFEAKIRIKKEVPAEKEQFSKKKSLKDKDVRTNIDKLLGLLPDKPAENNNQKEQYAPTSPKTPQKSINHSSSSQLSISKSPIVKYSPPKEDNPLPKLLGNEKKIILMPGMDESGEQQEKPAPEKPEMKSPKTKVPPLPLTKENLYRYSDIHQNEVIYTKLKAPIECYIPEPSKKIEKSPTTYADQYSKWYNEKQKESPMRAKNPKSYADKPRFEKYISSEKKVAWSEINEEARVFTNKIKQLVNALNKSNSNLQCQSQVYIPKSKSPVRKDLTYNEIYARDKTPPKKIADAQSPTNLRTIDEKYKSPTSNGTSPYKSSKRLQANLLKLNEFETPKRNPYLQAESPIHTSEHKNPTNSYKNKPPMPNVYVARVTPQPKSYVNLERKKSDRKTRSVSPTPAKAKNKYSIKKTPMLDKASELSLIREFESSKLKKSSSMKSILNDLEYQSPSQKKEEHNGSISLNFYAEQKGRLNYSPGSPFRCIVPEL